MDGGFSKKMAEAIVIILPNGVITYANQPFSTVLKMPLKKLTGANIQHFLSADSFKTLQGLLRKQKVAGHYQEINFINEKKAANLTLPVTINKLTLTEETALILSIAPTIQQVSSTQLPHSFTEEMTATLVHELNQPLAIMNTYIKGCLMHLEKGQANLVELTPIMQKIAQQSEHASQLITRIKDFIHAGKLHYEEVNINSIVRGSIAFINYELHDILATIRFELDEQLSNITVDKIQIEQVILNLVRNAIEAMRDAKTANAEIIIRTILDNNSVAIHIIDNGPGFSPELAEQMLDAYFTTKPNGTGMGLAICRAIIEAHGGHLIAKVIPTGGAWFQFNLPITKNL
jgi:signal transduction histidine kinase